MRIRIDDPGLASDLLSFLHRRVDLITARRSDTEADVSVLGSFADGGRAELDSHLEGWRRANPAVRVEVELDEPSTPVRASGPP